MSRELYLTLDEGDVVSRCLAEKVGISATGEEDQNELYPNDRQPADCDKTCLEWYREFLADPSALAVAGGIK